MNDQAKVNEDYRGQALYQNAKAAMQSVDAQAARINDILIERKDDRQQLAMVRRDLDVLTQRFNELFVSLVGNGATDGSLD